jgi:transposase
LRPLCLAYHHFSPCLSSPPQQGIRFSGASSKLNSVVMAFIEERLEQDGSIRARALAQEIETKLELSIHPRSIERALARKKKP